jgi:hypothetical protein
MTLVDFCRKADNRFGKDTNIVVQAFADDVGMPLGVVVQVYLDLLIVNAATP